MSRFTSRTNENRDDERGEGGDRINFIKRYPRAIAAGGGCATAVSRLFQEVINAAFICEILCSYCPVPPPFAPSLPVHFNPLFSILSFHLSRHPPRDPTSDASQSHLTHGTRKNDLRPSLPSLPLSLSLPFLLEALAGTPASSQGFRNVPLAQGGFRSEWVTARGARRCALQRKFITHYSRKGT